MTDNDYTIDKTPCFYNDTGYPDPKVNYERVALTGYWRDNVFHVVAKYQNGGVGAPYRQIVMDSEPTPPSMPQTLWGKSLAELGEVVIERGATVFYDHRIWTWPDLPSKPDPDTRFRIHQVTFRDAILEAAGFGAEGSYGSGRICVNFVRILPARPARTTQ